MRSAHLLVLRHDCFCLAGPAQHSAGSLFFLALVDAFLLYVHWMLAWWMTNKWNLLYGTKYWRCISITVRQCTFLARTAKIISVWFNNGFMRYYCTCTCVAIEKILPPWQIHRRVSEWCQSHCRRVREREGSRTCTRYKYKYKQYKK